MNAVIKTGGKQYRVNQDDVITVEKLDGDVGSSVTFDQVLLLANEDKVQVGTPVLQGAKVVGEITEQTRGKKIDIIKFKRRKHHLKRQGHRQDLTKVKIISVQAAS